MIETPESKTSRRINLFNKVLNFYIFFMVLLSMFLVCLFFSKTVMAQTSPQPAQITSPASGTSIPETPSPGLPVTFQWTAGTGVTQYQLTIGSSSGAGDIYRQAQGASQSVTVNIIATGNPLYVNIWSNINGTLVQGTEVVYPTTQSGHLFFVDPANGKDSNSGIISNPFQTIQKAFGQIGTIKNNNGGLLDEDVHIILRAGTHFINPNQAHPPYQPLILDSSYSGNNNHTVYIQAYPGETPIVSGGKCIGPITSSGQCTGIVPASGTASQLTFTVPDVQSGSWSFKRLRVGNAPAVRSRYPAYNPNGTVSKATFENAFPNQAASYGDNIYTCLQRNNYLDANGNLLISPAALNSLTVPNRLSTQFSDPTNPGEYEVILSLLKEAPYTSNVLFNDWCGKSWEKGEFNFWMNTGGPGGELGWNNIQIKYANAIYNVWMRYFEGGSIQNNSFKLTADGTSYSLAGLASTGWNNYAWVNAGTIIFSSANAHTLNLSAGSQGPIELDAMILTSDANFNPANNQDFVINGDGSYSFPSPYTTNNPNQDVLVIQAESADTITSPASYQPGTPYASTTPYNATNIPAYGFPNMICFSPGTFPNWSSWNGAQLFYFPTMIGDATVETISAVCPPSKQGKTQCPVSMADGYIMLNPSPVSITASAGDRFYIENVPEVLNDPSPNEWALDQSSGTLYYNAPAESTPHEVIAPTVETLIQLQGTSASYISNIIIDGLTFMDTDYPDFAYPPFYPPASYALELDYADNIIIRNSYFENLGSYAIGLENSSYHNFIYGNTLNNLGGGGIGIGYNSNQQTASNNNVISFNNISNVSRIYRASAAVDIQRGSGNFVSNNNITDTSGAGITVNAADGYHSHANSIEYNNFLDTVQEDDDWGAFYIYSGWQHSDTGTVLKYNFMKNTDGICSTSWETATSPCFTEAIYLDTDTSGMDIEGNIVENASNASISSNSGADLTYKNNIFYSSLNGSTVDFASFFNGDNTFHNISFTNNIFARPLTSQDNTVWLLGNLDIYISQATFENAFSTNPDGVYNCLHDNGYFDKNGLVMVDLSSTANQQNLQNLLQSSQCGYSTEYPAILTMLQQTQSVKTYFNTVDNNLYTEIGTNKLTSLGDWGSWNSAGLDTHSLINQDPLFTGELTNNYSTATNFTLQSGQNGQNGSSPALSLGFQQIPVNLIGNTGYPAANHAPVLVPVGDQTVVSGEQIQFTVSASSLDNDIASLTALNPPKGSGFVVNGGNASGTFTWTPNQPGTYEVGFLVQDTKGLSDVMTVAINVTGNVQYYWPLKEGGGVVSYEQNLNLNNALLYFNWACTAAANCPNGPSGWTTVSGPTGTPVNALLFNKNYGNHILITNDNYNLFPPNNGPFSIFFNLYVNSLNGTRNAIMNNEPLGFRIGISNQGYLQFWSTEDGGTLAVPLLNNTPPSSDIIIPGTWYQVAVSYNDTDTCPTANGATVPAPCATLYVNGQPVDGEQGVVISSLNDLYLGGIGGWTPFDGIMDELNIYNRALSAGEVTSIFKNSNWQTSTGGNGVLAGGLLGDVNGDGNVTVYDAQLTAQYAVGFPVSINTTNAKVDGKSAVDIYDAYLITEYAAGLITNFPVNN